MIAEGRRETCGKLRPVRADAFWPLLQSHQIVVERPVRRAIKFFGCPGWLRRCGNSLGGNGEDRVNEERRMF